MKTITLTQPWATLVAIGAKKIETRSWATSYRGQLAIHAAKGFSPGGKAGYIDFCMTRPVYEALAGAGLVRASSAVWDLMALPFGAIMATCNLTACHRIPKSPVHFRRGVPDDHPLASYPVVLPPFQDDQERAFGDYTSGRYAWLLADVEMLPEPIPAQRCAGVMGVAAMTTNVSELRTRYIRLRHTLKTDLAWRERVFPAGHPERERKLAEINQAIDDLAALGEAVREAISKEPAQMTLIRVPTKGRY